MPPKRPQRWSYVQIMLVTLGLSVGVLAGLAWFWTGKADEPGTFSCAFHSVTDGDTIKCAGRRVRLQGIDAPEMPGHCREGRECTPGDPVASKANLSRLMSWSTVTCRPIEIDGYGRTIARCSVDDVDLSCAQIKAGHAVARYADIAC